MAVQATILSTNMPEFYHIMKHKSPLTRLFSNMENASHFIIIIMSWKQKFIWTPLKKRCAILVGDLLL